jgi:A/G-specific adenine glycosylase
MLQQTRASTVIPYFNRWMARFPSFGAAADAEEEEILLLWSGLGYYARARHLHQLCRELSGGKNLPRTPDQWKSLPGVGPYTASAIASIGQNYDAISLDGNGIRVLSRLFEVKKIFKNRVDAEHTLQPLADSLQISGHCGTVSEALMDLGATICTPRSPFCGDCPLRALCNAGGGLIAPENIPKFLPKFRGTAEVHRVWIADGSCLWLRRHRERRLHSLYEIPQIPAVISGGKIAAGPPLRTIRRSICSVRQVEYIHDGRAAVEEWVEIFQKNGKELHAIGRNDLSSVPISGPHRRCVAELLGEDP